jgi:hypothetical protein
MRAERCPKNERGQIIVVTALMLTALMAFSALAIDVGNWLHTRTKLQADADAMALAGAQQLCGVASCEAAATSTATSYASKNAVNLAEVLSVSVTTDCDGASTPNHDSVTVRVQRNNPSFLAQLIGVSGADINACATAKKAALGGFGGVVPFGIEDECLGLASFGDTYTLKYDSDPGSTGNQCTSTGGNFGNLALDASGSGPNCNPPPSSGELKLKEAICFGANRDLCSTGAPDCVGEADDDNCKSQPVSSSQSCTEPGNAIGAIKEGVGYRYANTSTSCDTWEEVTFPSGGLRPNCNPWLPGSAASLRVIIIPIVDGLFDAGGSHRVDIVGFGLFFLTEFDESECKGSDCDIKGKFIKSSLSTGSFTGQLTPSSAITGVKLVK